MSKASQPAARKIKKEDQGGEKLKLELQETKDILKSLGEKKNGKVLVGFALETDNDIRNAKDKLKRKHLDFIVLNNPLVEGAGFGMDTNVVSIIHKSGKVAQLPKLSKFDAANAILDRVAGLLGK